MTRYRRVWRFDSGRCFGRPGMKLRFGGSIMRLAIPPVHVLCHVLTSGGRVLGSLALRASLRPFVDRHVGGVVVARNLAGLGE